MFPQASRVRRQRSRTPPQALGAVADAIQHTVRGYRLVARWGGEEFAVPLAGVDADMIGRPQRGSAATIRSGTAATAAAYRRSRFTAPRSAVTRQAVRAPVASASSAWSCS
ncbi:diguanylate cyclase domain-containing protein [Nocardia sp. NRRL S-836]|uniref:diguanylate cyclase domain-containing protein n=1 Tax=Nocardia sp. NRRL S-836 TaxID=1519492 RepID=UPI003510C1D8